MVKNAADLWMDSDDDDDLPEEIDDQQKEMDHMQHEINEQSQLIYDQQRVISYQAKAIRELQEHIDDDTEVMNQQLKFTCKVLKLFQALANEIRQRFGISVADQPAEVTSANLLMDGLDSTEPELADHTEGSPVAVVEHAKDLWMDLDDDSDNMPEEIDDEEKEMDDMQQEIDEQEQHICDQQQLINHQKNVIRELQQRVDRGTDIMSHQLKITSYVLNLFRGLAEEVLQTYGSSVTAQPAQSTSTCSWLMDTLDELVDLLANVGSM